MTCSRPLWGIALAGWTAAVPIPTHAAACCVGTTSALPTRVGECERGVAALGVRAEATRGWWDTEGRPVAASGYGERATLGSVGLGLRLSRAWEVQARLPVEHHVLTTDTTQHTGGGLGDARALVLWDPLEERPPGVAGAGPTPVGILGVRAPTGRDWAASTDPMNADVTGQEHPALVVGGQLERTLGRWPWSLGALGERDVAPAAGRSTIGQSTATFGRYLGAGWTVLGALSHTRARADPAPTTLPTTSTTAGARVVHGRPIRWRAWLGVDHAVGLPGFGRAAPRLAAASLGYAAVW